MKLDHSRTMSLNYKFGIFLYLTDIKYNIFLTKTKQNKMIVTDVFQKFKLKATEFSLAE